jgi:non-ribosomal peptide synthetase component E (peptide arylation enzyme)
MTSVPELASNLVTRVNVGDSLTRTANRLPDKLAMVDGQCSWTYAELNARVNRVANALVASGYARGDTLALASGNSCEFVVT